MVVVSWPLNDDPTNRDLFWWRCPHGDSEMSLCVRCYHPLDFIYVQLKRHGPRCPRLYSGCHRRCVGYFPFSLLFRRCSLTLTAWMLNPETLALVGQDDQDRPLTFWQCLCGNCNRTLRACGRCYQSTHSMYGTCPKTYTFEHRRASIQCRWKWYLYEGIDLHMGATTLQLHENALRRLERMNED